MLVGVGSAHGSDQAGWQLAQRVAASFAGQVELRLARAPSDILDWSSPELPQLMICDAYCDPHAAGQLRRWRWPTQELDDTRFSGSHDLPLAVTLSLADQLRLLPANVQIWGLATGAAVPAAPFPEELRTAIDSAAVEIAGALADA